MDFIDVNLNVQALHTALTKKLNQYKLLAKKVEGIIKSSVFYKYQLNLKGKIAQEMWKSLKANFQYISPISILHPVIKTIKIQLSDSINIYKYCAKYKKAYNTVCSFIDPNSELPTKKAAIFLQIGLLTIMEDRY